MLPMLGTIRVKGSPKLVSALLDRTCETRIGTVSIRLDACGDCYISLALASDEPFHSAYAQTGTAVGIDMNLANFFTDSDGVAVDPPHWLKKAEGGCARHSGRCHASTRPQSMTAETMYMQKLSGSTYQTGRVPSPCGKSEIELYQMYGRQRSQKPRLFVCRRSESSQSEEESHTGKSNLRQWMAYFF